MPKAVNASVRNALSRADFVALNNSAQKLVNPAFILQYRQGDLLRVGFTVTKRHGNAIARNRIRRRLREAVRLIFKDFPPPAGDYVFIARNEAVRLEFAQLQQLISSALSRIHKTKPVV